MSKVRSIVLALLFPSVCAAAGVDELAQELAMTAPTPCLDVAMPLQIDPHMQQGIDDLLVEIGQEQRLSSAWLPGNKHYDAARAMLLDAHRSDEEMRAMVRRFDGEAWTRVMFRRGNEEELSFLRGFFKTPEGKLFWENVIDGGMCESFFATLSRSKPMSLSPEQLGLVEAWKSKLAFRKEAFGVAIKRLDATQMRDFDRAWNVIKRLKNIQVPDEQAFQDTQFEVEPTQQAYKRIYRATWPKVSAQIDEFRAAGR